ncbi:hypothetical protein SUNI508_13794 [Seiridium unicorne]|uniref:CFEM domain-containing protein n=1 Tax=Seiridium unicorne TaxID=138068 RepID=A0ABR2VAX6_9PEZI
MLSLRTPIAIVALISAVATVEADDFSTNTTAALDAVPQCAYPCMLSELRSANCLSPDEGFLADCLCTNITLQADISICVQLSCDLLDDQKSAFGVENQICKTYPTESRASVALVTAIVTISISIPVVAARCATRLKLTKKLWPDDYMSLLSLAALLTIASIQLYSATELGSGRHYWNMDLDSLPLSRQMYYAAKILYVFIQGSGKLAILLLYQRVFDTGNGAQWFRRAIKVMIVLTFAIEGGYVFIIAFQCLPVASLWDPSITDAKCLNANVAFTAGAVLNIASDIVLMVLPIPALWKLQTSVQKRLGVALMLAIASLGIIASLVRVKFLVAGSSAFDSSYYNVDVSAWSLIELLCVVACGSIPALRPLLVHIRTAITSTVSSTFQRSRASGNTNSSRKSVVISAPRYSAAIKNHATTDSYSLSHLSTTNSTRHWKDSGLESPLERSPVVIQSRSSALVDIEAANLQSPSTSQPRPSISGSEDELIDVISDNK